MSQQVTSKNRPAFRSSPLARRTGRKTSALIGLALVLLVPFTALAAGDQAPKEGSLVPKAVAFIQTLVKGDFDGAEADFTDPMKQAAPPEKLREAWQGLLSQAGAFLATHDSKTILQDGSTIVIVRTSFRREVIGIAVAFDSAQRISGVHFVPPP